MSQPRLPARLLFTSTLLLQPLAQAGDITADFTRETRVANFEGKLSDPLAADIAASGGSLAIVKGGAKDGHASLQWNWKAGDRLILQIPPFDPKRGNGPYGNWFPVFQLWISPNTISAPPLKVSATAAGKPVGKSIPVSLEEAGCWRQVTVHYSTVLGIPRDVMPDRLIIEAPASGEGELRFDRAVFSAQFPGSKWPKPGETAATRAKDAEFFKKLCDAFAKGEPATPGETAWLEKMRAGLVRGEIKLPAKPEDLDKLVDKKCAEIAALTGYGDIPGKCFMIRGLWGSNEEFKNEPSLKSPDAIELAPLQQFIDGTAQLYANLLVGSAPKQKLGEALLRLTRHAEFQLGDEFSLPVAAVANMKDILLREGLYGPLVAKCVNSNDGYSNRTLFNSLTDPEQFLFPQNIESLGWRGGAMDQFARALFLLPDDTRILNALRVFKTELNRNILDSNQSGGGYMPDGSIIHHGVPNWAYASYCTPGFFSMLGPLYMKYDLFTPETVARLKLILMRIEGYCAGVQVPFSLRARWLGSDLRATPVMFRDFALHAKPGAVDHEIAAAYLNIAPGAPAKAKEPFVSSGIQPRPVPGQTFTMPWSCLLIHRRDGFLVNIKGFNTVVAAVEMQGSNRLARYLSHGIMEISNNPHGHELSFEASGFTFKGLDWNHLPGTTTKPLPDAMLHRKFDPNRFYGYRPRGTEPFAGGVDFQGRHGLFAMNLRDVDDKTLFARKSWFLFDNRVVCLGSDIACADKEYPIHTTLFQKGLRPSTTPVIADGAEIVKFPDERNFKSDTAVNWFIDPQGVGYVVAPGQRAVLHRKRQVSHAASSGDQTIGPATEDDIAVAWLDHGAAPTAGTYEYAVLINEPAAKIAEFARALGTPQAPYTVLRRDDTAHIVRDRATGITGCAFFGKTGQLPESIVVRSCDRPFLVMYSKSEDSMQLTLCDPELHFEKGKPVAPRNRAPVVTTLVLTGAWKAEKAAPANIALDPDGDNTRIRFTGTDATKSELALIRR